jgi:hypothetical protein
MYKNKITAWGLDKKNKRCEAEAILREKRKRDAAGQPCVFIARGFVVDVDDVERFCKRSRISVPFNGDAVGDEVSLPPEIQCVPLEPSTRPMDEPSNFSVLRGLFYHIAVHADSCFERGIWKIESGNVSHFGKHCWAGYQVLSHIQDDIEAASTLFRRGDYSIGGTFLRSAFRPFDSLVQSNCHNTLYQILRILDDLHRHGLAEIGKEMTKHLAAMAVKVLPAADPRRALCQLLRHLQMDSARHLLATLEVYVRDLWAKRLEDQSILPLIMPFGSERNYLFKGKEMRDIEGIVSRFDEGFGPSHSRTLRTWQDACYSLFPDRTEEAETLSKKVVQCLIESTITVHPGDIALAYYVLGSSQLLQKKLKSARENLAWALEFREQYKSGDYFDHRKLRIMLELKYVTYQLGEIEEVQKLQAQIKRMCQTVEAEDERERQELLSSTEAS